MTWNFPPPHPSQASLFNAYKHTHTHTHNVRFTIPNRRRQGRLQSCRQEATTIHRRLGEDGPRQRYALEERTTFQGRRELIHKFCLSMDKEEEERWILSVFFPRVKKRRDRLLPSIEEGFESVLDLLLLCLLLLL